MGKKTEESFAKKCLLTVPHIETSTTTQNQGGFTTQKRPMKLLREDQCVLRSQAG